ncbi:MAG: flippase activity-associated protein Agl23, partial [Pyrinomonadaceae bacterium]
MVIDSIAFDESKSDRMKAEQHHGGTEVNGEDLHTSSTRSSSFSPFSLSFSVTSVPAWCISDYLYWLFGILIIICGGVLRFYALDSVPLHHDEGVNGSFLITLFRSGYYVYQPENYHGPTLYYFSLVSSYLFGLNSFAIRLVTIIFGLGIILAVLLLRRELGSIGSIAAALMICISPGAVYLSRYFIHETLLVFFSLIVVVAAVKYLHRTSLTALLAGAASLALMFTTKETAFISISTLVISAIVS